MEPRERVLRALAFQVPDRPPISHAILPCAQLHYGAALERVIRPCAGGLRVVPAPGHAARRSCRPGTEEATPGRVGHPWRVTHQGRFGIPIECPIAPDWSNYGTYRWPALGTGTPLDTAVPKYRQYSGQMTGNSAAYYARGGWITFFEKLQQLHGFEATLEDLATREPMIYRLAGRPVAVQPGLARPVAGGGLPGPAVRRRLGGTDQHAGVSVDVALVLQARVRRDDGQGQKGRPACLVPQRRLHPADHPRPDRARGRRAELPERGDGARQLKPVRRPAVLPYRHRPPTCPALWPA